MKTGNQSMTPTGMRYLRGRNKHKRNVPRSDKLKQNSPGLIGTSGSPVVMNVL